MLLYSPTCEINPRILVVYGVRRLKTCTRGIEPSKKRGKNKEGRKSSEGNTKTHEDKKHSVPQAQTSEHDRSQEEDEFAVDTRSLAERLGQFSSGIGYISTQSFNI